MKYRFMLAKDSCESCKGSGRVAVTVAEDCTKSEICHCVTTKEDTFLVTTETMPTLSEMNEKNRKIRKEQMKSDHKAGVACDSCGVEMHYDVPGVSVSNGDRYFSAVHCPACGKRGELEV